MRRRECFEGGSLATHWELLQSNFPASESLLSADQWTALSECGTWKQERSNLRLWLDTLCMYFAWPMMKSRIRPFQAEVRGGNPRVLAKQPYLSLGDHLICIWDCTEGTLLHQLVGHYGNIVCLAFNSKFVASGSKVSSACRDYSSFLTFSLNRI